MTIATEYLHPLYRSIFTYIYFNELLHSTIKARHVILDKSRKKWFKMDRIASYLHEMTKFAGTLHVKCILAFPSSYETR